MVYRIKIVFIGDHSVGKSSLTEYIRENKFNPNIESTIGCLYSSMSHKSKKGHTISFDLWDTAGQERYRSLCSLYLRDAHIILLCVDSSREWNNYNMETWMDIINDICIRNDKYIYLIGTKSDLASRVNMGRLSKFRRKYNLPYFLTSSKNGEGISDLVNNIYINSEIRWDTEITLGYNIVKEKERQHDLDKECCLIS